MVLTVRFEVAEKLAPHLEFKLREIPAGVVCTILEISHAEQVLEQHAEPEGRIELGVETISTESVDADEIPELARSTGTIWSEPKWRNSDDGEDGAVQDLKDIPETESADSGLREETSGDSLIVAGEENDNAD